MHGSLFIRNYSIGFRRPAAVLQTAPMVQNHDKIDHSTAFSYFPGANLTCFRNPDAA